jgi:hypothetical protein
MNVESRKLEHSLRDLIQFSGISLKIIAHNSGMSAEECLSWWSGRSKLPPSFSIERLSEYLGVHKSALLNPEVDAKIISNLSWVPSIELPEQYSLSPLSFVSSSRHILEVIRLQFGKEALYKVMTKLKVPISYFQDIHNRINLKFFEDLLAEYLLLAGPRADLNYLSKALFISVEDSPLSDLFSMTSSYEEAFQQIELSTARFDINFTYRFYISKRGMELVSQPSEALSESMKDSYYGSDALYRYRTTLFGNMVSLCGLKPLAINVKSCISRGDSKCVYIANFH